MAKSVNTIDFPQKSSKEIYDLGAEMAEKAGYTTFKRRDIAMLLIYQGELAGERVSLNISVPVTSPNTLSIHLLSEKLEDEALLQAEMERLVSLIPAD